DLHRHAVYLQLDRSSGRTSRTPTGTLRGRGNLRGYGLDHCRHKHRLIDRSRGGFGLLAHLATPGEQLRMAQPMPPRYRADSLVTGIALRDDRRLNIVIPAPPSPRAGEHLQPLNWPSASIIT